MAFFIVLLIIVILFVIVIFALNLEGKDNSDISAILDNGDRCYNNISKAESFYAQIPKERRVSSEVENRIRETYVKLGECYLYGDCIEKDISKAITYFEKAQRPKAYIHLGDIYLQGNGVEKDVAKAMKFYNWAGTASYFHLYETYIYGEGVDVDIDKALEYLNLAINCCNTPPEFKRSDAYLRLGDLFLNGESVKQDTHKAIKNYERAFEYGSAEAALSLAKIYREAKQKDEAIKWFAKAASKGSAEAATELGIMYYYGDGVELDPNSALKLFKAAADLEYPEAQFYLAIYFEKQSDMERAIYWYKKSADNGYEAAKKKLTEIQ